MEREKLEQEHIVLEKVKKYTLSKDEIALVTRES